MDIAATDLIKKLGDIVEDLPEDITLDDLKNNEWLRDLVLLSDRVVNAVRYDALDWAKCQ